MKLHVSAYNDHRQVSIPIKKSLYEWGRVDVEISMHQSPVLYYLVQIAIYN